MGDDVQGNACFWGEDLKGVEANPITLAVPHKLVYSPHVYGPDVAFQDYFNDAAFPDNMPAIWDNHWAFVRAKNDSAVVVGEWGGKMTGSNGVWVDKFVDYLIEIDATDNFYW